MGTKVFAGSRAAGRLSEPRAGASVRPASASAWLEARALFVVAVSAVVVLSLLGIPQHLSQDGWLALVAGRQIAAHGIPQHDYFTVMAHGVRWVDQQWLAQLLMYELVRVGGLQLMTVTYVLVTSAAVAGGVAAARALGGEDLHVLACLVPGAFFYLVTAVSIRTQGLAYPFFVATLWLLASEVRTRSGSRRVYWVFPLLVIWANLHGSVTLGVGLAGLYGLTLLAWSVRARGLAGLATARAWVFIVVSPLTLLATPYGPRMIHYYRVTLLNSQFGRLVTEWKPVTSIAILAVPLFALIGVAAVIQLRALLRARAHAGAGVPLFDVIVLGVLAAGAILAVRNITWYGLALMILLPPAVTRMKRGAAAPLRRARVNQLLASAMLVLAALTVVIVLGRPGAWFTSTYPTGTVAVLRAQIARDPGAQIFADVHYADWLIWQDPRLFAGRVAYDTSLELLSPAQLNAIADPAAKRAAGSGGLLAPYRIWLLFPGNRRLDRQLLDRAGLHVLTRGRRIIIATRVRA